MQPSQRRSVPHELVGEMCGLRKKMAEKLFCQFGVQDYLPKHSLPSNVKIHEVGPRDGLQNEIEILSVENRIELIERLLLCGLDNIEVGSFVSPKWVPQMDHTAEVYRGLDHVDKHNTVLSVLTPNLHGYRDALAVNVREIAVFAASSEEFTKKNINCTIAESLRRYRAVCEAARQDGVRVRGYISCVLGCPYEGTISNEVTLSIVREFFSMGCYEVSLGDTIGAGTPESTHELLTFLEANHIPMNLISMHFHDTHNRALSNILVALSHGIVHIDSSISGLGGCPYAGCGSGGNVATEDVVWLLHSLGIQSGVKMKYLLDARYFIDTLLNRESRAKVPLLELRAIVKENSSDEASSESENDDPSMTPKN